MNAENNQIAYEITWESNHFEHYNTSYDATLIPFRGSERIIALADDEPYHFSEPIVFNADPQIINHTDYPDNNVSWPIMSRRMLDVLQSVGEFPHEAIPLVMKTGRISRGTVNQNFVAVQLTSHLNILNYEQSIYDERYKRREESLPDRISGVREFVINPPSQGLPPLFRLSAYPVALFISCEARQALRDNEIKGTAYVPLYQYRYGEAPQVDIPVPLPTDI